VTTLVNSLARICSAIISTDISVALITLFNITYSCQLSLTNHRISFFFPIKK
jgi:hypothetical protein